MRKWWNLWIAPPAVWSTQNHQSNSEPKSKTDSQHTEPPFPHFLRVAFTRASWSQWRVRISCLVPHRPVFSQHQISARPVRRCQMWFPVPASAAVSFPMRNHWMDDFSPGFSSNNQLMDKWSPQIVHSEALKRPFTVTTRTLQHLQVRDGAWVIGRHGSVEVASKRVQACASVCWYLSFYLSIYLQYLSVCLSIYLSAYLPTYRPIYVSIYLF